ncbi:uncharacterized protein LOC132088347 [Daphnia carinata]|uniref:uncharacterized protein LOC132088347 n=1 Tax=Daphnia carinata TaxID=120202 RepID=UPI0028693EB7|nr:uncharacterized protein LOC132088347 [Daphnia carinata]
MTGRKRGIPNHPAQHSFAIVKFHLPGNAHQYDIAPIDWIRKSGNRSTCYWPGDEEARNGKQLINLITKNADKEVMVDKETWLVFTISIIAKFDTYKGAQDKLKNVLAGEIVVSTDLEKRGKGGRSEAKKRKAAAATSSCISVGATASSSPVPGPSTGALVSVTDDEAVNDDWLNGASSVVSFTGLPELLTSEDDHGGTKENENSADALPSIPLPPAFPPLRRAIPHHLPYARKSAPPVVPANPMELSQTVPYD